MFNSSINSTIERIVLGTAQFGMNYGVANKRGKISEEEVYQILNFAYKVGIKTIDTAVVYGESERVLGNIGVRNFDIISKIPKYDKRSSNDYFSVKKEIVNSINRLKVDSLHAVLLHDSSDLILDKTLYESLWKIKQDGLIKKIGVSIYHPFELDDLLDVFDLDIVQSPFNLFDQRIINSKHFEFMIENNIEIHVRSIFLQGLLLMDKFSLPEKFKKWESLFSRYYDFLERTKFDPLSLNLSFPLSFKNIDKFIIGVDSLQHLEQIVSSLSDNRHISSYPEIISNDLDLINPSNWQL